MPVTTRRSLIATFDESTSITTATIRRSTDTIQRRTLLTAAVVQGHDETPTNKPAKKQKKEPTSGTPTKTITKQTTTIAAAAAAVVTPSPPPLKKSPSKTTTKKNKTPPSRRNIKKTQESDYPPPRLPPPDYESIYSLVEELRADRTAPVDDNGSEALPQRDLGEETFRFQVLVALMLSSQTKDGVVGDAMRALQNRQQNHEFGGLTVDSIVAMPPEVLNGLIAKVGFHNNKTRYIKQAAQILKEEHGGDVPGTADELMALPGVGPKMAYIVEHVAWGRTSGIGVDTHMHRIFNALKWVTSKNPEQTRLQLESWLPREKWDSANVLWVGFGQEVQQFKPKLLEKALRCSRPVEALRLVKRLGLDYKKEADKAGLTEKLKTVLLDANNKIKMEE